HLSSTLSGRFSDWARFEKKATEKAFSVMEYITRRPFGRLV
ncbi:MAG: hypothetical protein ACJAUW_000666, partial [Yoonia sp.]